MATQSKKPSDEMNFERAMDRLEQIVDEMESGKMMLEDLIVRYEEGMKLVGICQERLTSAEKRIEIITRNHAGKQVVKDFDAPPEVASRSAAKPEASEMEKNDDVRLF